MAFYGSLLRSKSMCYSQVNGHAMVSSVNQWTCPTLKDASYMIHQSTSDKYQGMPAVPSQCHSTAGQMIFTFSALLVCLSILNREKILMELWTLDKKRLFFLASPFHTCIASPRNVHAWKFFSKHKACWLDLWVCKYILKWRYKNISIIMYQTVFSCTQSFLSIWITLKQHSFLLPKYRYVYTGVSLYMNIFRWFWSKPQLLSGRSTIGNDYMQLLAKNFSYWTSVQWNSSGTIRHLERTLSWSSEEIKLDCHSVGQEANWELYVR